MTLDMLEAIRDLRDELMMSDLRDQANSKEKGQGKCQK
jgi:hypothetical protein